MTELSNESDPVKCSDDIERVTLKANIKLARQTAKEWLDSNP
jgi:hypothetical protein